MTEPRLPFEECWETVRGRAAGSNNQYSFLYAEIIKACERPGHFAEVGAYKGASGKMMAMLAPDKEVHIFETFEGFPAPTVFDSSSPKWAEGSFASDFDDTAQFLADCANIKLHVGVFPETSVHVHDHEFAFVHLDTDLFESTRDGIQFFLNHFAEVLVGLETSGKPVKQAELFVYSCQFLRHIVNAAGSGHVFRKQIRNRLKQLGRG